jgi:hypothetical protein
MTIARFVSLLGLFIVCAILAIAMGGTPRSGDLEARESDAAVSAKNCHSEEIALDEGYGVTRREVRRICAAAD